MVGGNWAAPGLTRDHPQVAADLLTYMMLELGMCGRQIMDLLNNYL